MEKDTYTPMFITALFTIARTWKQSKCQSADEWIKKLYIYTMDYYSAIKRNTFESVLMRWMNLECIIQSQVSQKDKDKYHIPASFVGDLGLILGLERSHGGGHGNPLQYSCLKNSMDRGAWQATVHGVTKSWT